MMTLKPKPEPTTRMARAVAFVRGSPWVSLLSRAFLFFCALAVLAWIGRATTAATKTSSTTTTTTSATATLDAGILDPPPPSASAAPTPPPPQQPPHPSSSRATPEDPVYVNHAGVEDLKRLPGVGAKRAEGIIALRQRIGRFQRVEDLLRVKGIGRATVKKWRPLVRLDNPPVIAPAMLVNDAGAR